MLLTCYYNTLQNHFLQLKIHANERAVFPLLFLAVGTVNGCDKIKNKKLLTRIVVIWYIIIIEKMTMKFVKKETKVVNERAG
jgi:hypothetical protein